MAGATTSATRPSNARRRLPPEHPPTIYLPEPDLHDTVTGWLSTAILGPDHEAHWQVALDQADDSGEHHLEQRLAEVEQQIADLNRRLDRQILNLEADDLTASARDRIAGRTAELEAQIEQHQTLADQLRHQAEHRSPSPAEAIDALDQLPQIAERPGEMPAKALREFYDSLALKITYDAATRAIDIEVTLASQVCSVPPAGAAAGLRRPRRIAGIVRSTGIIVQQSVGQ